MYLKSDVQTNGSPQAIPYLQASIQLFHTLPSSQVLGIYIQTVKKKIEIKNDTEGENIV